MKTGTYKAWRCYRTANHGVLKTDVEGKEIGCNNNSINEKALLTCMKYCVNLICHSRKQLRQEILSRIHEVCGEQDTTVDEDKIQQKIDSIEEKKWKSFDAMLQGEISKTMDDILSFREENEMLYREILEKIVVYRDGKKGCNRLVVWLKHLPFGLCLTIRSTGRGEDYHTEILECRIIESELEE